MSDHEPAGTGDRATEVSPGDVVNLAGDNALDGVSDHPEVAVGLVGDLVAAEGAAHRRPTARHRAAGITARLFRDAQPVLDFDPVELPNIVAVDKNFAWIDLTGYAAEDLHELAGALDLHPMAVRTALSPWRRPRLDVYPHHFFVSATVAHVEPASYRVQARQIDLFVGRNFLLSVHKHPLPFGERVAARAAQSPDLVRLDSAFMLYLILDQMLEYYDGLTEQLEEEIEAMEERALEDTADPFLEDLLRLKRFVFALGRLVDHHRDVFTAFLRPDFRYVAGHDVEPHFRDLEARLSRLLDRMSAARDAVNGTFDIYVSHVSQRTNDVMKILTVVSTVVLPATVVLGVFGTSFEGLPIFRPLGFVIMLVVMALMTAGILVYFRRRGWV